MSVGIRIAIVTSAVVGLVVTEECRAQAPIPTSAECYTMAKYYTECQDVVGRRLKIYESFMPDSGDLKTAAIEFLKDYERTQYDIPGCRPWSELATIGKKLRDRGSQDPLVWDRTARAQFSAHVPGATVEPTLWKSFAALNKNNAPAIWRITPLLRLSKGWAKRVPRDQPSSKELVAFVADAWIRDPDAVEADRRFRWGLVKEWFYELDIDHKTIFIEKCSEYDAPDGWLFNLLLGAYHIDVGWHHRGDGYADTVTEQGAWQFQDNLRRAAVYLHTAWQIDPRLPEPAAFSITTAMAGDQPTADAWEWFDRAVAAQMDYLEAYESYRWSLRPRWGGSHEAMLAFGKECLATERFGTLVPHEYYVALQAINNEIRDDGGESFAMFRREEEWNELSRYYRATLALGDRGYTLHAEDETATQWMLAAAYSGHFDDAVAVLKLIDDHRWEFGPHQLDYYQLRRTSVRAIVSSAGGPGATAARKVLPLLLPQKRVAAEKRDDALSNIEALLKADDSEPVQQWFGRWRQTLIWEKDYDDGKWVELTF